MDGLRRKVGEAIQRHHPWMAKAPQRPHQAVLIEALKDLNKDRIACPWGERSQQRAALRIAGNRLHATPGVDVILSFGGLEGARVVQQ
jgi:hypothetical protein